MAVNLLFKSENFKWIDVFDLKPEEIRSISSEYDINHYLLEDCIDPNHLPKFEDLGELKFLLTRINTIAERLNLNTISDVSTKLGIFLKKDLILNSFENNIFNLGSGTGISLNEILEFIKKNVDKNFDVIYEKERDFDIKKNILDIKKIKEKLNWSPKIKIKEGIEYTLNWMKVDS